MIADMFPDNTFSVNSDHEGSLIEYQLFILPLTIRHPVTKQLMSYYTAMLRGMVARLIEA